MTIFEYLVRALCGVAFSGDPKSQREASAVVIELAEGARRQQFRELRGLVALVFRRSGSRAVVRHGGLARAAASLAAPAVFYVTAASLATMLDASRSFGWFGVALLTLAGSLSAYGSRSLTLLVAVLALWPVIVVAGPAIVASVAIALGLTRASTVSSPNFLHASAYFAVAVLACFALSVGLPVLDDGVVRITTVVLASVLIGLGVLDPRFALVAAVIFGCRFVTFDLAGLADALGSLGRDLTIDELVARSIAMATGLVASLVAARHSTARASVI